jgi:hypothetical protein
MDFHSFSPTEWKYCPPIKLKEMIKQKTYGRTSAMTATGHFDPFLKHTVIARTGEAGSPLHGDDYKLIASFCLLVARFINPVKHTAFEIVVKRIVPQAHHPVGGYLQ